MTPRSTSYRRSFKVISAPSRRIRPASEPRLVGRADHSQIGIDFGTRHVVVDDDGRGGVDVDIEVDTLERGVALFGEIELACGCERGQ